MNAAKGRLRTILHSKLYEPVRVLLDECPNDWTHSRLYEPARVLADEFRCDCDHTILYMYLKALHKTGVWPLEDFGHKLSMSCILNQLKGFSAHFGRFQCTECGMRTATSSYASGVSRAVANTKEYFDGLCLDCMQYSKFENTDNDYWQHAKDKCRWDSTCRAKHGQPTWYFSFSEIAQQKCFVVHQLTCV